MSSPKSSSTLFIFDKRWTNNESTDEIYIIFEGPIDLENGKIEGAIIFHRMFDCFELILFQPPQNNVWARFYIPKDNICSKLRRDDYDQIIEEKKDFFRKRHRHFDLDALKCNAKAELLKRVILSLIPDLLSFDLSHRLQDESHPYVQDIFRRPAIFTGYDLQSLTYIAEKPTFLVPANLLREDMDASYAFFLLSQRQFHICRRIVRLFQSTLSRKYSVQKDKYKPSATALSSLTKSGKFLRSSLLSNIRKSFSPMALTSNAPVRNIVALYAQKSTPEMDAELPADAWSDKIVSDSAYPAKKASISKRLSIFLQRKLSIIAAGFNNNSSNTNNNTMNSSFAFFSTSRMFASSSAVIGPIPISSTRYRWLQAIHKVITRNLAIYYRQLLRQKVMLQQLKRMIVTRHADYHRLIEEKLCSPAPTTATASPNPANNNNNISNNVGNNNNTVTKKINNSPAVLYRNLSTMVEHRQNMHTSTTTPEMSSSPTSSPNNKSFKRSLASVRAKIASASAFARFQHLKINTKVGVVTDSHSEEAKDGWKDDDDAEKVTPTMKWKPSPHKTYATKAAANNTMNNNNNNNTALNNNAKNVSSAASVASTSTSISSSSSSASSAASSQAKNNQQKIKNPPLTASTPSFRQ